MFQFTGRAVWAESRIEWGTYRGIATNSHVRVDTRIVKAHTTQKLNAHRHAILRELNSQYNQPHRQQKIR
jgi:hypothetical protein